MIVMIILALVFFPQLINGVVETYRTRKEGQHSYLPGRAPFVTVFLSFSKDQYIIDILNASLEAVIISTWLLLFINNSSLAKQN
jgi:hypothetical protein